MGSCCMARSRWIVTWDVWHSISFVHPSYFSRELAGKLPFGQYCGLTPPWSNPPMSVKMGEIEIQIQIQNLPFYTAESLRIISVIQNKFSSDNASFHESCLTNCPRGRSYGLPTMGRALTNRRDALISVLPSLKYYFMVLNKSIKNVQAWVKPDLFGCFIYTVKFVAVIFQTFAIYTHLLPRTYLHYVTCPDLTL